MKMLYNGSVTNQNGTVKLQNGISHFQKGNLPLQNGIPHDDHRSSNGITLPNFRNKQGLYRLL